MKISRKLEATAYHEAGHAVAAYHTGLALRSATIIPDAEKNTMGAVLHRCPLKADVESDAGPKNRNRAERLMLIALAGPAAERKFWGRVVGSDSDYQNAADILTYLTRSSEEWRAYMRLMEIRARQFVVSPFGKETIPAVAGALLAHGHLGPKRLRRVIREASEQAVKKTRSPTQGERR